MYNAKSDFEYNNILIIVMHKPRTKLLISALLRNINVSWSWDKESDYDQQVKQVNYFLDTREVKLSYSYKEIGISKKKKKKKEEGRGWEGKEKKLQNIQSVRT